MTFRVANNQFHIGWKETCTAVVTIVTTVWGVAWYVRAGYDSYVQNQQETNRALMAIQRELSINNRTDSTQTANIAKLSYTVDSALIVNTQTVANNRKHSPVNKSGMKFYTERWVNGQLVLTEVKQD